MLLTQLRTSGMEYIPTCLVGLGLVRHSLVPDLLGPAQPHHGLGIYLRLQLGYRLELYHRVLHHPDSFPRLLGRCQPKPCRCLRLDQNQNSFCEKCYTAIKLSSSPWTFSCETLPGVLSNRTKHLYSNGCYTNSRR